MWIVLPAVLKEWECRGGLEKFVAYFQMLRIQQFPGWQLGYLGNGCPRTNNAMEGTWPTIHQVLRGIYHHVRLLHLVLTAVIPILICNAVPMKGVVKPLTCDERHEAEDVSKMGKEMLYDELCSGTIQYCIRTTRTRISAADVSLYKELMQAPALSYSDVKKIAAIVHFNSHECTCERWVQYGTCLHTHAANILCGDIEPEFLNEQIVYKETRGRPVKPNACHTRQQ